MKTDWQRLASIGICATLALIALFLIGEYLISVIVPFLIAWLMAWLTDSISARICRRVKIPRRLCAAAVLILLFFSLGGLLFWGITRFFTEIENFITGLTSEGGAFTQNLSELIEKIETGGSSLRIIGEFKSHERLSAFGSRLEGMISSFLKGLASDMGAKLTSVAAAAVRLLPSIILFVVISIIASFYFALDFKGINEWLACALPPKISARLPFFKEKTRSMASRYLKAYAILTALTFFEVFIGLTVIGVSYSFIMALLISLLDLLPILGVGTLLVPWSLYSFFIHDFSRGLGLLILWAAVTVIRQIAEPKIVGGTMGLHPAATLMGMYAGFRLFGIIGMLLAPAVIIAIRSYAARSAK